MRNPGSRQQSQERGEKPQADQQRHPPGGDKRDVQLRVDRAVGLIVLRRVFFRPARGTVGGRDRGILAVVLQVVQRRQRTAPRATNQQARKMAVIRCTASQHVQVTCESQLIGSRYRRKRRYRGVNEICRHRL